MASRLHDIEGGVKPEIGRYDSFHEESEYESALAVLSKNYGVLNDRIPSNIKRVMGDTQNRLKKLKLFVDPNSPYLDKRIESIENMEGLRSLTMGRVPPWGLTIMDQFLIELGTDDLYYGLSIRNSCKYGDGDPEVLSDHLRKIVERCESSARERSMQTDGHIKRAEYAFAYLEIEQPILPEVIKTGDPEILYGGHLETLEKKYFPRIDEKGRLHYRRKLGLVIWNDLYNYGPTCRGFPNWIRALLKDSLPKATKQLGVE